MVMLHFWTPLCYAILSGIQDGSSIFNQAGWCAEFEFLVPGNDLANRVVAFGQFDSDGRFEASVSAPSGLAGQQVKLQATMQGTCPAACMSNIVDTTVR